MPGQKSIYETFLGQTLWLVLCVYYNPSTNSALVHERLIREKETQCWGCQLSWWCVFHVISLYLLLSNRTVFNICPHIIIHCTALCLKLHVLLAIDRGMPCDSFATGLFKVDAKARVLKKCFKSCGQNYELKLLKPFVARCGTNQICMAGQFWNTSKSFYFILLDSLRISRPVSTIICSSHVFFRGLWNTKKSNCPHCEVHKIGYCRVFSTVYGLLSLCLCRMYVQYLNVCIFSAGRYASGVRPFFNLYEYIFTFLISNWEI